MNLAFAGFRHNHILSLYRMALTNESIKITGCYEENMEERNKISALNNINFTYKTYEEILNDHDVSAVAIGDYYAKRGQMIIDALKCGKHVICDKPICTKLSQLDEIERLTRETGLKVSCMLDLRYMNVTGKAKQIIQENKIGKIHAVSVTGQHCLDYDNRPKWYFEKGKHGGTINDIAIHGIDLISHLTGKKMTKVVGARTWNAFAVMAPDFKDCAQFMLDMDGIGVVGDVSYSAPSFGGVLPTYWSFYFWGTEGMMYFCLKDNIIHIFENGKSQEETIVCENCKSNYLDDFISEVKGISSIMNTQSVIDSSRGVLQIQRLADNGK